MSVCPLLTFVKAVNRGIILIQLLRTITKGVPQGSRLWPDLFNIFMNDIFSAIQMCELANYADDNSISKTATTVEAIINALILDTQNPIEWFGNNFMKVNLQKFKLC